MAEVGPDANVWVIDWYNYIVQHNPTPLGFQDRQGGRFTETDVRDRKHGRIYRVVYDGDKLGRRLSQPRFRCGMRRREARRDVGAPEPVLAPHAQRLLVSGESAMWCRHCLRWSTIAFDELEELGLSVGAIHSLWTLHGLGELAGSKQAARTLHAEGSWPSSCGRAPRCRAGVAEQSVSVDMILKAKLLSDPDAQVRLVALLALADLPSSPPVGHALMAVFAAAENRNDPGSPTLRYVRGPKIASNFCGRGQRR